MKKAIIFTLLFCASVTAYAQQQIPKIGVIDYSRIVQQMMPNSDQLQEIVNQIQYVAESEGYSIIFDSKDRNIIWWTHSVDITDLVMKKLRL